LCVKRAHLLSLSPSFSLSLSLSLSLSPYEEGRIPSMVENDNPWYSRGGNKSYNNIGGEKVEEEEEEEEEEEGRRQQQYQSSKASSAGSWIQKKNNANISNDDDETGDSIGNSKTTVPSRVSKEVEEALSFAKRTKEKNQQQQQQQQQKRHNNNNNSNNNNSKKQQQQMAKKVVFAPAPSKPVWNTPPATSSSLTAQAQPFSVLPNANTTDINEDDGVQWPTTAENNGGKHAGKDYLPKITAESLRIEARKSKVDKFGKIPCRVCGRRFAEFQHLASHLYNSHYGLNDPDRVKVIDTERIARGDLTEQERIEEEKRKKKRTTIDLSEIVSGQNKSINAGGGGVSAMLGGLGLYFKEGKTKKSDKSALLAKKVEGRPKRGGELMANPNAAMASATLVRRGKERMDGKKKKRMTKLRKIILVSRANKKESSKGDEESTVEVTIEVGKVYVNIKVDEEDSERVKVDLWCDEDDDDSDDDDNIEKATVDEDKDAVDATNTDTNTSASAKENVDDKPYIVSSTSSQTVIQLPSIWTRKSFIDTLKQKESELMNTGSGSGKVGEQTATSASKKTNKKEKSAFVPKFCDLCKMECNSETAWADHVAGKKHAKMLERKERIDRGETTEEQIQRNSQRMKDASFVNKVEKMPKYASQVITTPLNQAVQALFSELRRLQERLYKTDPIKAKSKKRFTFGLREVVKNVELGKCKAVVVAPNIESTGDMEGGLDDQIWQIVKKCRELNTPVLFALTRSRLGKLCGPRYVSCVAVLNTDGLEDQLKAMLREGQIAQKKYEDEKAVVLEKEEEEAQVA